MTALRIQHHTLQHGSIGSNGLTPPNGGYPVPSSVILALACVSVSRVTEPLLTKFNATHMSLSPFFKLFNKLYPCALPNWGLTITP